MQSRDKRGDGSSRHSLPWSLHDGDKAASIHFLYCSDTFPRTEIYANLSPLRPLQPWKLQDTHTLKENPCVTRKLKQRVSAATQSIASVLRLTPLLQCCDSLHWFSAATHSIASVLRLTPLLQCCDSLHRAIVVDEQHNVKVRGEGQRAILGGRQGRQASGAASCSTWGGRGGFTDRSENITWKKAPALAGRIHCGTLQIL